MSGCLLEQSYFDLNLPQLDGDFVQSDVGVPIDDGIHSVSIRQVIECIRVITLSKQ